MNNRSFLGLNQKSVAAGLVSLVSLAMTTPALAHHPFDGRTPTNAIEGFLSGLGHPVIGPDHRAFVVVIGLLAAVMGLGFSIPVTFIAASMAGTGLHLLGVSLPAPEVVVSASVLLFGILLAMQDKPGSYQVLTLAGLAGLFHGYAYGEAVVGADMGSIVAYLLDFASIQLLISTTAYYVAKRFSTGHDADSLNL
jgi:urease accessory protein